MAGQATERLRNLCLAVPEAPEKQAWGNPTFRVKDRIFAMGKRGDGRVLVWCKAPSGVHDMLVGAGPARVFVPPHVGSKGWTGRRLDDRPDREEVAAQVRRSDRLVAPRRLAALSG